MKISLLASPISQIHDHFLLLDFVHFYLLDGEGAVFAREPLGASLLAALLVGAGPGALALGLYRLLADHQIVGEADQVVGGEENGFVYG